jgi:hypothetical protein
MPTRCNLTQLGGGGGGAEGRYTEPVFVNVYGAQESITRNRYRQHRQPGGPIQRIGFIVFARQAGNRFRAPKRVNKYGLRQHMLA